MSLEKHPVYIWNQKDIENPPLLFLVCSKDYSLSFFFKCAFSKLEFIWVLILIYLFLLCLFTTRLEGTLVPVIFTLWKYFKAP